MSTVRDHSYTSLIVTKNLTVPVVQNIQHASSTSVGSLVYNKSAGDLTVFGLRDIAIPVSAGTSNLSLDPLATGESIVYSGTGPNIETKGVVGNGTLTLTPTATDLELSVATTTYIAGTGIDITGNVVSNTVPQVQYTFSNGLSESLNVVSNGGVLTVTANPDGTVVVGGTSTNPVLTGNYQGGTNVTIVGNTISIPGGSPTVLTLTAANSTMIVDSSVPTNPVVYGNYQSGTGISIAGNTITNTTLSQLLAGDTTIVIGGTPTNPTVACGYVAGSPQFSITGNVLSLAGPYYTSLTAANNTVVIGGTSSNPTVSGNMQPGTNVTITGNVVSRSPSINAVTAGDTTIVVGGTPQYPTIQGNYQSGTGISIAGNTISYVSGVDTVTSGNTTVVVGGTALNPTISGNYQAGTNIVITENTIDRTGSVYSNFEYVFSVVTSTSLSGPYGTAAPVAPRFQVFNDGPGQFLIGTTSPTNPPRLGSTGFLVPEACYIKNVTAIMTPYSSPVSTLTLTLYINYSFVPNPAQILTLTSSAQINTFSSGFFCPAGSIINPILTSSADSYSPVSLSFKKIFIQLPNTLPPPPTPLGLTFTAFGAGGLSSLLITYALNDPLVFGVRLSMNVGLVPPATWAEASSVKVGEVEVDAFYGDTGTSCGLTLQLAAATTYAVSAWFINGNDPPDMSVTPYQTTFTTSA